MGVSREELERLYADTTDPWNFRTSAYERARFDAIRRCLGAKRYQRALELGCGNGELARHLGARCGRYVGVDAVATAIEEARKAYPSGDFRVGYLPADLPEGQFDLIVLSEILYFFDEAGIRRLARRIEARWPAAELVCVTWLGPTGHPLSGLQALDKFKHAFAAPDTFRLVFRTDAFRIDSRPLPGARVRG